MKVGDLVMFKREHVLQSGFEYCSDWIGIVTRYSTEPFTSVVTIHWTCPDHRTFQTEYTSDDDLLEVISENR